MEEGVEGESEVEQLEYHTTSQHQPEEDEDMVKDHQHIHHLDDKRRGLRRVRGGAWGGGSTCDIFRMWSL